jgi:hypothetical protein
VCTTGQTHVAGGRYDPRMMLAVALRERLLAWMRRQRSTPRVQPEPDASAGQRLVKAGKYVPLYTYLENRFANRVVLTFAEIEDLLGFTLPDLARLREDWWTGPDSHGATPGFSDSWILANRTARPNLLALTVVFDRAV